MTFRPEPRWTFVHMNATGITVKDSTNRKTRYVAAEPPRFQASFKVIQTSDRVGIGLPGFIFPAAHKLSCALCMLSTMIELRMMIRAP